MGNSPDTISNHDQPGPHEGGTEAPYWNLIPHYKAINWDHPDQEIEFPGLDVPRSWKVGDELYVGLRFDSKRSVQMAVKHYSMKIHETYFVVESKPTYLTLKCPNFSEGCPWRMRAMLGKKSNKWVISKWGGQHTCMNAMLSQDHQKLDSEFVSTCIFGMVVIDPSVPISLIQERIKGQFGYSISYRKAWKAKQKAIVRVYGDWDESYELLPSRMNFYHSTRNTLLLSKHV